MAINAKRETAQRLRYIDLLTLTRVQLFDACKEMEISTLGEREECIERLHRRIWQVEFNHDAELDA